MANMIDRRSKNKRLDTVLEQSLNEAQNSRAAKRLAQHQHWMRVMMEGQATPDLRFQKPKV